MNAPDLTPSADKNATGKINRRFDGDGDEIARHFLSPKDLAMSPEEYAARKGHLWGCYSLDRYRYRDPELGAWVRRFGEIYSSGEELEQCRQRFLTPDELAEVRRQEAEGF